MHLPPFKISADTDFNLWTVISAIWTVDIEQLNLWTELNPIETELILWILISAFWTQIQLFNPVYTELNPMDSMI